MNSSDFNSLTCLGDVPMVYKSSPYNIYYASLYVIMLKGKPFFSINTNNGIEAIAPCTRGKWEMKGKDIPPFEYNAENGNVCVRIPNYKF